MANITKNLQKYFPYLLALSIAVILTSDSVKFNAANPPSPGLTENKVSLKGKTHAEGSDAEIHGEEHADHNDPANQKRMGIFHYNEGNKFLYKGNFQKAVINYKMALRHDPDNANFYINLSSAYMKEEKFDKAYETLTELESKSPGHPLLYYNRACYYSLINETDSSRKALEKSAALGFKNFREILTDPDLRNLRKTTGFPEWFAGLKRHSEKPL